MEGHGETNNCATLEELKRYSHEYMDVPSSAHTGTQRNRTRCGGGSNVKDCLAGGQEDNFCPQHSRVKPSCISQNSQGRPVGTLPPLIIYEVMNIPMS